MISHLKYDVDSVDNEFRKVVYSYYEGGYPTISFFYFGVTSFAYRKYNSVKLVNPLPVETLVSVADAYKFRDTIV